MKHVYDRTAVGLIVHQNQILLLQRPKNDRTYGLWCFPGGTVEDYESPAEALDRELFEEVGILVQSKKLLIHLSRTTAHRTQDLFVYCITSYEAELSNPENHVWTWALQHQLSDYPSFKINLIVSEYIYHHPVTETQHTHTKSFMKDTIVVHDAQ